MNFLLFFCILVRLVQYVQKHNYHILSVNCVQFVQNHAGCTITLYASSEMTAVHFVQYVQALNCIMFAVLYYQWFIEKHLE